jgi:uncharacterized protein with beta-barrel porin domain
VAFHHRLLASARVREAPLASPALERGTRLVVLTFGLLALGNAAQANCDANGNITGANTATIVLGSAGCATAPGILSATVVSGATITAAGTGVASVASPGWAVTNQGSITATGNAVTGNVTFTLTNSGAIAAGLSGALVGGGSTVVNSIGGTITGGFIGLSANGGSTSGGPSSVDNAGTIASTGSFDNAIVLGLGGTVTNRSTGTISANGVGVASATNPTVVNNSGQILDASTGIGLSAGGTVTNDAGAVINSQSRGIDISGGVGTVVNSGSIVANFGRPVQLQAGGSVTNTSTGTITSAGGGTRAIFVFGGPSTIINAGSVNDGLVAAIEVEGTQSSITNSGTIRTASGAGIRLDATTASNTLTTIVNSAGGTVQGAVNALVANGNASVDFTNKGSVVGGLAFGAGDASLHFYTGSSLTGNLTAGTGTNTISFNGSGSGTFSNAVANFQTITKQDDGTWTLSGVLSGATAVSVTQGKLILSAANTYTGATTVNSGALIVDGSIASSILTTVNGGGKLGGNGTVGSTNINGGTLAPGNSIGLLTVQGNLAFTSAAYYMVEVSPANVDRVNVTGTATLGGATVNASVAAGTYVSKQYTIVNATGGVSGTFNSLVNTNLPSNFTSSLSYDAQNVYLNLVMNFVPSPTPDFGSGLNVNQQNVANTLINFFNTTGGIPLVFGTLTPAGLTQLSGETATGSQQTTFNAMNLFMSVLNDPFLAGRGDTAKPGSGATPFAEASDSANAYASNGRKRTASERDAYAMFTKAPIASTNGPRWSVWAAGFGGSQTTDGNATLGSNDATSRIGGVAVGADYRFSPNTIAGFALAGGGTSFGLANALGSGRSDLFQAGAFARHTVGPAYISAALAYGWQDITTDRTVTVAGIDQLRAKFTANAFSGRVEGGYRFVTPWMGITPYAAGQFTTFDLPAYAEQAIVGTNTFALAYGSKSVTATRSELGLRADKSFAMQDGILTLRARAGWAHDYNTDRNVAATFQTLPGASFVVNGAVPAKDAALVTASAEMKWLNGFSLAATFEGEFSNVTTSYAGKGVVRYQW